jgi:1-acyl-sn-glycerol-3-phosphate acyltransferase
MLDVAFAAFATPRRIRFMAKREIFTTRLGGSLFSALGAIEVDRGATDRGALRASKGALESGEPLGIFPEGTRRDGPVIEDLFDGCAYLALKLGVPMVPVGIGGSEEIMPTGRLLPRVPRVTVVIGAPIESSATTGVRRRSEVGDLTEVLRERLQECFDQAIARAVGGHVPPSDAPSGGRSAAAAERREDG